MSTLRNSVVKQYLNDDPSGSSLIQHARESGSKLNNHNISFDNLKVVYSNILSLHKCHYRIFSIMTKKYWLKEINNYLTTDMNATQFASSIGIALKVHINNSNWKLLVKDIRKDFENNNSVFYFPCFNPYPSAKRSGGIIIGEDNTGDDDDYNSNHEDDDMDEDIEVDEKEEYEPPNKKQKLNNGKSKSTKKGNKKRNNKRKLIPKNKNSKEKDNNNDTNPSSELEKRLSYAFNQPQDIDNLLYDDDDDITKEIAESLIKSAFPKLNDRGVKVVMDQHYKAIKTVGECKDMIQQITPILEKIQQKEKQQHQRKSKHVFVPSNVLNPFPYFDKGINYNEQNSHLGNNNNNNNNMDEDDDINIITDNTLRKWFEKLTFETVVKAVGNDHGLYWSFDITNTARRNIDIIQAAELYIDKKFIKFIKKEFISNLGYNISYRKYLCYIILCAQSMPETKAQLLHDEELVRIFKDPRNEYMKLKEFFNNITPAIMKKHNINYKGDVK